MCKPTSLLVNVPSCSASVARELIVNRVSPWEVIGDVSWHDGEWRAFVTLTPSGPLMLMGFKISPWEKFSL